MSTGPTPSPESQPKINQKRSVRTLVYVLILGAAALSVRWYVVNRNDPTGSFGSTNSAGMIAAIEFLDEGQQVVAFDAKGKKIVPEGYRKGAVERDLAWQPDGNRLFFVSDRVGPGFQIYRWTPAEHSEPEVRSIGSLGKSSPAFPAENLPHAGETMLMVSGGFVLELSPKDTTSHQVLPPLGAEVPVEGGDEGGGQANQFTQLYSQIGESFRAAKWCFGKDAVAAVMRRERGEALLVQPLPKGDRPQQPMLLAIADHIDFDVNPADGSIVFTATELQLSEAELRKQQATGKKDVTTRHILGFFKEGDKAPHVITGTTSDVVSFDAPRVSPDGERVVVTVGPYDPRLSTMSPKELLSFPNTEGATAARAVLVEGQVFAPSWSPTGKEITYIKVSPGGKRSIYVINSDGSGERSVSGETGDFATPVFSPQKAEPAKP